MYELVYSSFTEMWRLISPPWLLRSWGDSLIATFGARQDEHHARARSSVKARFPDLCSGDALAKIGADRGLPQATAISETLDQWRVRLEDAWAIWADAGTDKGILRALHWAGFVDCTAYPTYDPQDPAYVFDPNQSVIVASAYDLGAGRFDAPNTSWSVFWVIADAAANSITLDTHTWDDGTGWDTWGDETVANDWSSYGTWDLDTPEATVNSWRAAVRKWKPAHATCPYIIIRGSSDWADVWGSFGAWGDADEGVWGSTSDTVFCTVGEAA